MLISQASSGDDISLKYLHLQEREIIPVPIKDRAAHRLRNEGMVAVSGGRRRPGWASEGLQGETKCKSKRTPPRRRVSEGNPLRGTSLLRGANTVAPSCTSMGTKGAQKGTSGENNKSAGQGGETLPTCTIWSLNTAFFSFLHLHPWHAFVIVSLVQIG